MRVSAIGDLHEFAATALPWLRLDPVRHNVITTVIESRRTGVTPLEDGILLLNVLDDGGALAGVALRTPPHPMLVPQLPSAALVPLAEYVATAAPEVQAFNGSVNIARVLAEQVACLRGGQVHSGRALGRFQLTSVIPPAHPVTGSRRPAGLDDIEVVMDWVAGFHDDIGSAYETDPVSVRNRIAKGLLWVWVSAGQPVSMAGMTVPADRVVRINYVYTPPAYRGRGYASALVARMSQSILDDGNIPVLYTDLENPTSNKIYQAIGFCQIDEAGVWHVVPAPSAG